MNLAGAAQYQSKRTVVGTDVESLFPSLDDLETANPCYKAIMNTKVELDNGITPFFYEQ